ncbi:MAG TPA: thiamine diphosphokinase [Epulopiscium sp.]|nr:thiamine diphosphokinase [Candidatus Epulonipiscium sp.]
MKIGILTNGKIENYDFYKEKLKGYDFIICADGGLAHALHVDVTPEVAVGDFDSTPTHIVDYFRSKGTQIIRYSTIKNETDTEIALAYAFTKNPKSIDIFAGLGSRLDHSLANVHLLKQGLEHGVTCRIITEHNEVLVIDSAVTLNGKVGDGVSLLPLTEHVSHVCTKGLAYPVEDGEFHIGAPYGVSNYMSKPVAEVKINGGLLLVIKYRD